MKERETIFYVCPDCKPGGNLCPKHRGGTISTEEERYKVGSWIKMW